MKMISESIDFILSHFSNQSSLFPRKMMTNQRRYQFAIYSKDEIVEYCKQADYIDCRVGAYPEYTQYKGIVRQSPDFVFVDLDLTNFNNDMEKLDSILKRIKNKIERLGGSLTILWTGNGYHVYLPLTAMVLDQEDIFSKENFPNLFQENFSKYYGYSVSEVFLKFAKEYLSNGKADSLHHPKYGNSLTRIPGTYNSKCLNRGLGREESEVKIIERWDGKRLPIQLLLKDFRRWIMQEEVNYNKNPQKRMKQSRLNMVNSPSNSTIKWIERLLEIPLGDYRKYCLWRILGPYLLNVRKLSEEDARVIMEEWLQKCDRVRKLDFGPRCNITSIIRGNKHFLPISFTNLNEENNEIFLLLTKS